MECRYLTKNWQLNYTMMLCVLKPVSAGSSVRKCCLFNVDCTFMRMFYWIWFDFYLHTQVRPSLCEKQKQAWGHCEGVAPVLNDFPQVHKSRVWGLVDSWWLQILICHDLRQICWKASCAKGVDLQKYLYWVTCVYISIKYFHCSPYSGH